MVTIRNPLGGHQARAAGVGSLGVARASLTARSLRADLRRTTAGVGLPELRRYFGDGGRVGGDPLPRGGDERVLERVVERDGGEGQVAVQIARDRDVDRDIRAFGRRGVGLGAQQHGVIIPWPRRRAGANLSA